MLDCCDCEMKSTAEIPLMPFVLVWYRMTVKHVIKAVVHSILFTKRQQLFQAGWIRLLFSLKSCYCGKRRALYRYSFLKLHYQKALIDRSTCVLHFNSVRGISCEFYWMSEYKNIMGYNLVHEGTSRKEICMVVERLADGQLRRQRYYRFMA